MVPTIDATPAQPSVPPLAAIAMKRGAEPITGREFASVMTALGDRARVLANASFIPR